jgi:IMP dehydrogenase
MGGAERLAELVRGRTFDDFLFKPQRSVLERRDPARIDLTSRLSRRISLRRPIVSANMDTVTRAAMAIVQAEEGGIGVIDRGFRSGDIEPQVREVQTVKRTQHGIIPDPYTIGPGATLDEARAVMERSGVHTLAVVDDARVLRGMLTERDMRFVPGSRRVAERMTPRERLAVHEGLIDIEGAERVMVERKVKKLPLVDRAGRLAGLITARDILTHRRHPFATRDAKGRLRVAAAIGAKGDYLERAAELIRAEADAIVIDIAHAHSVTMEHAIEQFRKRFGGVELVGGNVGTGEGARFLAERGVDAIKVGIGPGGGCTTRITTSFGVPQLQALVECRRAVGDEVPIIADGGISRDGALMQALVCGDTAMLGSAFAGTLETPGEVIQKPVLLPETQRTVRVPFKVLRGMASIGAIKDRLDLEDAAEADVDALGAEGLEISVPARGSVRPILQDMMKHLCSSISYAGASSLAELRALFWGDPRRYLIPLSEAARRESYERPGWGGRGD